jgi:hypothetical protein
MIVNKLYPFATHSGDEQTQNSKVFCKSNFHLHVRMNTSLAPILSNFLLVHTLFPYFC